MNRDIWTSNRTRDNNIRRLPLAKDEPREAWWPGTLVFAGVVVLYFAWQFFCR